MKGILITNKGLEEVSAKEIKDLLNTKVVIKNGLVEFKINDYSDLCKLTYKSQSARRVILLLKKFSIDSLEDLKKIKTKNLDKWLSKKSFKVLCERHGTHAFNSLDVRKKVCQILNYKVDYKNPEVILYLFINQKEGYLGIDFSGFDLGKRYYNIFIHRESPKANITYAVVSYADIKPLEKILDPFCKSGLIMIEASNKLLNQSVHKFKKENFAFNKLKLGFDLKKFLKSEDSKENKLKFNLFAFDKTKSNIISAKKNARIAEVDEIINFENRELTFLSNEFEKQSVDKIITKMPVFKNSMKQVAGKVYKEFFHQANILLKKNGKIVILCNLKDLVEETKNHFIIKKKLKVISGKESLNLYVLTR